MAKPIITAKDMAVTYNLGKSNEFKALKGVTFDIYSKEYIILFGPSGCGKSTIMYAALGVLPPARGEIIVKGEQIYDYDAYQMVEFQRSTVGIIYQSFNLIPSISVLDNVILPQIFAGIHPKERDKRGRKLLKQFGVEHAAHKVPTNLSGGQQQRVAVSRSLVGDPEILLADEPVGNLDSVSADAVMNMLDDINAKDKKTVILITHDAKYLPYAHRIFYLKDGLLMRVVTNPEKEQVKRTKPGETIVTELEKLARLYPYEEPAMLRVKSAVNYLTQGMDVFQLERVEKFAQMTIEGKMSKGLLFKSLRERFDNGGAGLRDEEARDMSERMEKLIEQSQDIRRFRAQSEQDSAFVNQAKYAQRIRQYVTEETGQRVPSGKIRLLEDAITERVGGIITHLEFAERLSLPLELGGVELPEKMAEKMTKYLEKLVAQGVSIVDVAEQIEGSHT